MMKAEKILIMGGKGTSLNIAHHLIDNQKKTKSNQEFIGFCVDTGEKTINEYPVLCNLGNLLSYLDKNKEVKIIYNYYRPDKMFERFSILKALNIPLPRFANFIHYSSTVLSKPKGFGNVILSNVSIMSNVVIHNFNIINSNVVVEHDSIISCANFIAAGATLGAGSNLRETNFIGLNSSIKDGTILQNTFVGMQSLVTKDFTDKLVYGVPAKIKL